MTTNKLILILMNKTGNEQTGNSYVIIFALWLLVFSSSSQIMIVSPMLPQIGRQLDVAVNLQGLLVSVYAARGRGFDDGGFGTAFFRG